MCLRPVKSPMVGPNDPWYLLTFTDTQSRWWGGGGWMGGGVDGGGGGGGGGGSVALLPTNGHVWGVSKLQQESHWEMMIT